MRIKLDMHHQGRASIYFLTVPGYLLYYLFSNTENYIANMEFLLSIENNWSVSDGLILANGNFLLLLP